MKRIKKLHVLALLLLLITTACGNEDSKFEPIDIKVTGLVIHKDKNCFTFTGEVGPEGGVVSFEGFGKYSKDAYPTTINLNGEISETWKLINGATFPLTIIDGGWADVVVSSDRPWITTVTFKENTEQSKRYIELQFGGGYHTTIYRISQQASAE